MTDKERPLAKSTVQTENDRVIVTEWRFPPGSHTGWHKHMHDYVVVPITTGELHIFDGKTPNGQEFLVPKAKRQYDGVELRLEGRMNALMWTASPSWVMLTSTFSSSSSASFWESALLCLVTVASTLRLAPSLISMASY